MNLNKKTNHRKLLLDKSRICLMIHVEYGTGYQTLGAFLAHGLLYDQAELDIMWA